MEIIIILLFVIAFELGLSVWIKTNRKNVEPQIHIHNYPFEDGSKNTNSNKPIIHKSKTGKTAADLIKAKLPVPMNIPEAKGSITTKESKFE